MPSPKSLKSFLKGEKGGITKKSLVDAAVATGLIFVLSQATLAVDTISHSNTVSMTYQNQVGTATHSHHANHTNHNNVSPY